MCIFMCIYVQMYVYIYIYTLKTFGDIWEAQLEQEVFMRKLSV